MKILNYIMLCIFPISVLFLIKVYYTDPEREKLGTLKDFIIFAYFDR